MPNFPIVDAHVHLWDPRRLRYSWQRGNTLLDRPYLVEDYQRALEDVVVEAMVFLECFADFTPEAGQYLEEITFVEGEARRDPRIRAIVPMAPLERGRAVEPMIAAMVEKHPKVKGIRRIIEFEPDVLALSPDFLEGVALLEKYGLHFEVNVNHTQMDLAFELVKRVPGVRMILDHCGKPGIAKGAIDQYRNNMREFAKLPNLWIKLSDLPVEAHWINWTGEDLRPYIDATLEYFGIGRIIYAGDYPVCLQATTLPRWVKTVDEALDHLSPDELRQIYRDNAMQFYRLEPTQ